MVLFLVDYRHQVPQLLWQLTGSKYLQSSSQCKQSPLKQTIMNPLHPNISMHILHTVLYTFLNILPRRILWQDTHHGPLYPGK